MPFRGICRHRFRGDSEAEERGAHRRMHAFHFREKPLPLRKRNRKFAENDARQRLGKVCRATRQVRNGGVAFRARHAFKATLQEFRRRRHFGFREKVRADIERRPIVDSR